MKNFEAPVEHFDKKVGFFSQNNCSIDLSVSNKDFKGLVNLKIGS